jgi:putative sterol carrier protein
LLRGNHVEAICAPSAEQASEQPRGGASGRIIAGEDPTSAAVESTCAGCTSSGPAGQPYDGAAAVTRAADVTSEFFDDLGRRGHEPLLGRLSATLRFDIVHGRKTDRWLLAVSKGDLAVSRQNRKADCVLRAEKGLFDRVASGEQNAMAAVLRGELVIDGDWTLLVLAQRLFPGPAASRESRPPAAPARRRS